MHLCLVLDVSYGPNNRTWQALVLRTYTNLVHSARVLHICGVAVYTFHWVVHSGSIAGLHDSRSIC